MLSYRTTSEDSGGQPYVKKADTAYLWLRDEILSFRMEPGAFIDKTEICKRLQISKQPVTAAVTRLEQEGLVEIFPQRGSYVARLRLSQMKEAVFIRYALEMAAAFEVCEKNVEIIVQQLRSNLAEQRATLDALDTALFRELDIEFHRLIGHGVDMGTVAAQVEIGLAIGRRCLGVIPDDMSLFERAYREHARIVEALSVSDGASAARELNAHRLTMQKAVQAFADERPELFLN